jgi:hypothetical protein
MLGIEETAVWALAKEGILPRRHGDFAMFARQDVEAAARLYIFGPEMLDRSVFKIGHELNRWLKSREVEPTFAVRNGQCLVYDRARFEAVLAFQPKPLDEISVPTRKKRRVPADEKQRAVEAVKSGLTPHHVALRMGVDHTAVAKWVRYFDETGKIQPAAKLDPYEEYITEKIELNPWRT